MAEEGREAHARDERHERMGKERREARTRDGRHAVKSK